MISLTYLLASSMAIHDVINVSFTTRPTVSSIDLDCLFTLLADMEISLASLSVYLVNLVCVKLFGLATKVRL